jgi:hypothetical protein
MNKLIPSIFIVLVMMTFTGCWSGANQTKNDSCASWCSGTSLLGSVSLSHKKMDNLRANGTVTIDSVVIVNNVNINGSVSGDSLSVGGTVGVNGTCIMSNMHITGATSINGLLKATDSNFSTIKMSTNKLVLIKSSADSIVIRKPDVTETEQQVIELDATVINSNILFEKEGGKVIARNGSKVNGSIIGGVLEYV